MGGCLKPVSADAFKRDASEPASFYPSSFTRRVNTPCLKAKSGFREMEVDTPYTGGKKILVLGTSKFLLPCKNGTYFNTGHHTTETLVPMFHFDAVGFKFDIATEDGSPLALEEWTFPMARGYEGKLHEIRAKVKTQLENPLKYDDIAVSLDSYAAVFLPGGHGPIIDMHNHQSLGKLLRSAHDKGITTISLCHGPSALRAAAVGGNFPYTDYKINVFPDGVDQSSPMFGYLPGYLSEDYLVGAKLKALGCQVTNKDMDDSIAIDRELITGASQLSAQRVAEAALAALAPKFGFKAQYRGASPTGCLAWCNFFFG